MTDIFKGLGFWIAQSEALKAISKQFPDLITRSVRARDAFNRNFSPAILQIFYTLEGASKGELT
ncbi:MAG: hypothetical protein PHV05_06665, partial [Candidatus Riflebacteria bacterium]|nr:hypothetical protein [Candidatus Riflebacteria bacterium]